jgi:hypothetical protein
VPEAPDRMVSPKIGVIADHPKLIGRVKLMPPQPPARPHIAAHRRHRHWRILVSAKWATAPSPEKIPY